MTPLSITQRTAGDDRRPVDYGADAARVAIRDLADVRTVRQMNQAAQRHAAAIDNVAERLEYFAALAAKAPLEARELRFHAEQIVAAVVALRGDR
jgi:hypothetical protein